MSKNMGYAFLCFSLLYMFALSYDSDYLWLLKVIPIVVLGGTVIKTEPSLIRRFLLLALIFSGCGDLLLAFDQFIYGVAAFLLAQLCYAVLFSQYWRGLNNRWYLSIALLMYMLGMAWWLMPHLEDLQLPVMAYLIVIAAMGLLAVQSSLPMSSSVLGAIVFIISDSFIAINKFIAPVPMESYWIMSTYYIAQFMLVTGFLNSISQSKEI